MFANSVGDLAGRFLKSDGQLMRQKVSILAHVLAVGSLLLAGCANSSAHSDGSVVAASTTSTNTGAAAVTPTSVVTATSLPSDPAVLGWTRQGSAFVDVIQQSPAAPNTVYACGPHGDGSNGGLDFARKTGVKRGRCGRPRYTPPPASRCMSRPRRRRPSRFTQFHAGRSADIDTPPDNSGRFSVLRGSLRH